MVFQQATTKESDLKKVSLDKCYQNIIKIKKLKRSIKLRGGSIFFARKVILNLLI